MNATTSGGRRRWPLVLLALPAAVAIWSGWVGLGQMAGFGVVHPLPGIADHFELNSAITLPIGVEAYSAYALGTWLSAQPISPTARRFAAWSSLAALGLGLLGQVIYHLLRSWNYGTAPVAVVVLVACLPVLVLGAGAALHHLLGDPETGSGGPGDDSGTLEHRSTASVEAPPASRPVVPTRGRTKRSRPRRLFADYLEQARTLLDPGTDPTPSWCRRETGCSAGTSVKLAAALRAELDELVHGPNRVDTTDSDDDREAARVNTRHTELPNDAGPGGPSAKTFHRASTNHIPNHQDDSKEPLNA